MQGTAEEGEAQVQEGPTPGRMAVGQTLSRAVLAGPQLTGGEGAELLSLGAPGKVRTRAGQHPAVTWPRPLSRRQRGIDQRAGTSLVLKVEERALSQGICAASKKLERPGHRFSPRASGKQCSPPDNEAYFDFRPVRPVRILTYKL